MKTTSSVFVSINNQGTITLSLGSSCHIDINASEGVEESDIPMELMFCSSKSVILCMESTSLPYGIVWNQWQESVVWCMELTNQE